MRQFFYCVSILVFLSAANSSLAFLDLFSSPCGCSRLKAGQDIASLEHESALKGKVHFEQCLQCEEIKEISDIKPYLDAFLRQLPEREYSEIAQLFQKIKLHGQSYALLFQKTPAEKGIQIFLETLRTTDQQKPVHL